MIRCELILKKGYVASVFGNHAVAKCMYMYNGAMNIIVFDSDTVVKKAFDSALAGHSLTYIEGPVTEADLASHPEAEIISIFVSSQLSRESIDLLPSLKLIVVRSTGFDHIDTAYAASKGIAVATVPRYGGRTVAEFTFALLLSLSRRIPEANARVREDGNFSTSNLEGFDLFGKAIGVIGTGNIGRNVVRIAEGFGMEVRLFDLFPDTSIETKHARYVPLDELLAVSDIVSLHVPSTAENKHLLDAAAFAKMKRGAYVINTARGDLIDTVALVDALKSGQVGGAGLDVIEGEHALKDDVVVQSGEDSLTSLQTLVDLPHVVITPHVAFSSREAYREILATSVENIAAFARAEPVNLLHL